MARPYRRRAITSVSRSYSHDPLDRIDAIGGMNSDHTRWQLSQVAAIAAIEAGTDEFFFEVEGQKVKLIVLNKRQEKYLWTDREATHVDDVLRMLAG